MINKTKDYHDKINSEAILRKCLNEAFVGAIDNKNVNIEGSGSTRVVVVNSKKISELFIKNWFYNNNEPSPEQYNSTYGSFHAVFRKNIRVTDIAQPEFIVLCRKYLTSADTGPFKLQVAGTKQFDTHLSSILLSSLEEVYFEASSEEDSQDNVSNLSDQSDIENKNGAVPDNLLPPVTELEPFIQKRVDELVKIYGDTITSTCIVDFLATGSSLHVPRSMRLDAVGLVADSGYIHSFGHQVYVRRADKAEIQELKERLLCTLSNIGTEKTIYLTVYSQEFFNNEGKNSHESMHNGLDQLKLSARKHHIGDKSILDAIPDIVECCDQAGISVHTPKGDDYVGERNSLIPDSIEPITVFILQDRDTVYSKTERSLKISDKLYLVVYAQILCNENPLIVFKESKPGWAEPVTMPHTLSAAHLNIALGRLNDQKLFAIDPFCGTGTSLLDIAQRRPDARLIGLDKNPISKFMVQDNFEFFGSNAGHDFATKIVHPVLTQLDDFKDWANPWANMSKLVTEFVNEPNSIKDLVIGNIPEEQKKFIYSTLGLLLYFISINSEEATDHEPSTYNTPEYLKHVNSTAIEKFLSNGPFLGNFTENYPIHSLLSKNNKIGFRLLIMLFWRSIYYRSFSVRGGSDNIHKLLLAELKTFKLRTDHIQRFSTIDDNSYVKYVADNDQFEIVNSLFSLGCRRPAANINRFLPVKGFEFGNKVESVPEEGQLHHYTVEDSVASLKQLNKMLLSREDLHRPNLIVTDPPYGFNTTDSNTEELENLFFRFGETVVQLLDSGGVLAVTLPDQAKNGKRIPFFETREMFVRQLLSQANRFNRNITQVASILPDSKEFPRPAFRWNAERGVSRHCLVFTITD